MNFVEINIMLLNSEMHFRNKSQFFTVDTSAEFLLQVDLTLLLTNDKCKLGFFRYCHKMFSLILRHMMRYSCQDCKITNYVSQGVSKQKQRLSIHVFLIRQYWISISELTELKVPQLTYANRRQQLIGNEGHEWVYRGFHPLHRQWVKVAELSVITVCSPEIQASYSGQFNKPFQPTPQFQTLIRLVKEDLTTKIALRNRLPFIKCAGGQKCN